jgi:hypothetical protein
LVTVVPLSTTVPNPVEAHHYRLKQNPIPGAPATEVWAKCDMLAVVSIERLDLVRTARGPDGKRRYLTLQIGHDQFDAIRRVAMRALTNNRSSEQRGGCARVMLSAGVWGGDYNCGMGLRFRRSTRIFPGVRINLGKRGVSTSIGVRGAHVTFGKIGIRTTVGIPGTGVSYTHLEKARRRAEQMEVGAAETSDGGEVSSGIRGSVWASLVLLVLLVFLVWVAVKNSQ